MIYILDMRLVSHPADRDVRVRRITAPESLLSFIRDREREDRDWSQGAYADEIKRRFEDGDWCFCVEYNRKPASVVFVSRGPCYLSPVDYTLNIPDKTVGFYDVYTLNAYRGKRLYAAVFQAAVNTCVDEGYTSAWMWIMPDNYVSFRTHKKLGMRHIFCRIEFRQLWGFRKRQINSLDLDTDAILKDCGTKYRTVPGDLCHG
ncbi:MAG TPA: GNAT family N-acetyltransferase [bacterium]